MRIVFMGTPEIAAVCLEKLVADGKDIVLAVTGEDKPRGRGKQMTPTAVKSSALAHGIPVITPSTLRTQEAVSEISSYAPDLIVVVAYGKILPVEVLNIPKHGCINLHVSLLPKYRGAAPMQRAIMEGETETGVTVMYMAEGLDTGDIISVERFPISDTDDFEAIHDRSSEIGSKLLSDTVDSIAEGTATRTPQNSSLATYAKKVEKADAKIDFTLPASKLHCIIRGTTPIPGAFAYLDGKMIKLSLPTVVKGKGEPGQVIDLSDLKDGYITVACGTDALRFGAVIPEGKGKMTAGDFVRGRKIALGDVLK